MARMSPASVRIALVAPFGLRTKGTARARCLPLGKALARRGYEVALFVPAYDEGRTMDDGRRTDYGRRAIDGGVEVIHIPLSREPGRGGMAQGLWHLGLGWRTYRTVAAWQPHIVHAFKPKGPSGLAAMFFWLARRPARGPRLVVDSDDWEGAGGWNDDPRVGYTAMQRRFFAWQERYGLSHADAWTVTSACLAERAAGFGADPRRIYRLPNGLSDFGQELLGMEPAAPGALPAVLLYTRFAGVRAADVVALWTQVRAAWPAATLTVVGRGVGGEERELLGVPGVEVAGWQEPAALGALFGQQTCAIAPWADTPANRARHSAKVLELMAAGLPVVATAVGELPATLGDGGIIVPPGDMAAAAAAVAALLADARRAARLGMAARARVAACYHWDALAAAALSAYGE